MDSDRREKATREGYSPSTRTAASGYIYIYIYIEKERDLYVCVYKYVYDIYIYIYIYICFIERDIHKHNLSGETLFARALPTGSGTQSFLRRTLFEFGARKHEAIRCPPPKRFALDRGISVMEGGRASSAEPRSASGWLAEGPGTTVSKDRGGPH